MISLWVTRASSAVSRVGGLCSEKKLTSDWNCEHVSLEVSSRIQSTENYILQRCFIGHFMVSLTPNGSLNTGRSKMSWTDWTGEQGPLHLHLKHQATACFCLLPWRRQPQSLHYTWLSISRPTIHRTRQPHRPETVRHTQMNFPLSLSLLNICAVSDSNLEMQHGAQWYFVWEKTCWLVPELSY